MTADYERWQQLDFVVGIRIELSNNHTLNDKKFRDICDELSEPLDGRSVNRVTDVPQEFTDWVRDNSERIEHAKSLPYFIKDNKDIVDGILNPKQKELTTLEKAKLRHDARTPEQIEAIKNRWAERQHKHELIKKTAGNVLKVASDYGEVDYSKLQQFISAGNLTAMQTEARIVAKQVSAFKKQEAALSDLIPDVHGWHKQFSMAELQTVHASIKKTLNRFTWDFTDEANLQDLKKKLSYEISWMETKGKKYATWEISRDAYKHRLALVEHRLDMIQIKNRIANEISILETSKSVAGKKLVSEFNSLFVNNDTAISDIRNKANAIKAKVAQLEVQRTKRANKTGNTSPFTPKSDAETKADFIAFAKSKGILLNENNVVVDKGFIHLQSNQHKRLYDALQPETSAERRQLWNHRGVQSRWGASGYIQTGNSFLINGDFRETGVVGKLDADKIAKLRKHGALDDDIKTIQLLDKKIEEFSLPIPLRVTRYVNPNALDKLFGEVIKGSTADTIVKSIKGSKMNLRTDAAFLSASTNEMQNVFTGFPVKIEIEVPPNTPMYLSNNYLESEVVFGRSTALKFISVSKQGRHAVIRCRIIK